MTEKRRATWKSASWMDPPRRNPMIEHIEETIIAEIKSRTAQTKVHGETLGNPFSLKSINVRKIVNKYRSEPFCYPIASDPDGYWWARTIDELEQTDKHLESRIIGIQNARSGLKIAAKRMAEELQGQGRLL